MKKLAAISSVMLLLAACAHKTTPVMGDSAEWSCYQEDHSVAIRCVPRTDKSTKAEKAEPDDKSRTPSGRAQVESDQKAR